MDKQELLESPFLTDELFSTGTPEWEAGAMSLASESPFVNAVEMTDSTGIEDLESVPDRQSPFRIRNTIAAPHRWICNVSLLRRGTLESSGTGLLISDRHVLTAAHVVVRATMEPATYSVNVTPALNYGVRPFGSYRVIKIRLPAYFSNLLKRLGHADTLQDINSWGVDYALLTLDERVGKKAFPELDRKPLCYWGHPLCGSGTAFVARHATTLPGKLAVIAGYPVSHGGNQLWSSWGRVLPLKAGDRTMRIYAVR